jgi:hypothetical protein
LDDDKDSGIQELRDLGIIEEKWFGSLLEQYAGFLSWFKREFEGKYRHCLANEVVHRLPWLNKSKSRFNRAGADYTDLGVSHRPTQTKKKVRRWSADYPSTISRSYGAGAD